MEHNDIEHNSIEHNDNHHNGTQYNETHRNGTTRFEKCKQLLEYQKYLLLRDIWW
jgi:hypothetical protein